MLFAKSMVMERALLDWSSLPNTLGIWLQSAGGVAAFAIVLVYLARYLQPDARQQHVIALPTLLQGVVANYLSYFLFAIALAYGFIFLGWIGFWAGIGPAYLLLPRARENLPFTPGDWILILAGGAALTVAVTPIAADLVTRISWGRIWAITRLSWKEAVRGRVVWVFGAMSLVILFADWFIPFKPEDQVRNYVRVVYWSMTPLFLMTAVLLGAFSIPNDVKNNSIHTIVTKPVEKFELVLGRFFGYAALLTIGLAVVSCISLVYVVRGVNEEAQFESFKARVPIYGNLKFAGTQFENRAENIGREFTYRSYIKGTTESRRQQFRQFAIWDFAEIPEALRERVEPIIFEFAFDVYRLSKGDEGEGVKCTFTFVDVNKFTTQDVHRQAQQLDQKISEMRQKAEDLRSKIQKTLAEEARTKPGDRAAIEERKLAEYEKIRLDLIEEFGIYQVGASLLDYHTQVIQVPPEAFKILSKPPADQGARAVGNQPALRVFVSLDVAREAQMLGVAPFDFYLLAFEKPFWQNFLKGVIGMWCTHMLVLGVAIACSTYLSSVISLLMTFFLFLAGMNTDYLRAIAHGQVAGGGPAEALVRLSTRMSIAGELEKTPTTSLIHFVDSAFGWWINRILNLIPDIDRHDLNQYVANGFDIGWTQILFFDNVVPLAGYLIPWAVLAYYLMKFREIANPS
ncbi:MAG: hypothetical protein HYX68_01175 [Planctomycetes bacterium]|nr:hypothetical protein [Planctomycetota bacterium]